MILKTNDAETYALKGHLPDRKSKVWESIISRSILPLLYGSSWRTLSQRSSFVSQYALRNLLKRKNKATVKPRDVNRKCVTTSYILLKHTCNLVCWFLMKTGIQMLGQQIIG